MSRIRLTSLADAARAVATLGEHTRVDVSEGTWSAARVLHHLAAGIECSVRGFPRGKPWLVRAIARRFVLPKFLRQGFMTHDRNQELPGVEPPADPALAPAIARLLAAIDEFTAAPALAPHFVFGPQPRDLYDRYHALHVADHLSAFTVDCAPFALPAA